MADTKETIRFGQLGVVEETQLSESNESTGSGSNEYQYPQPFAVLQEAQPTIEWHESSMAMLKHHGWRRHAGKLGISLAEIYRQQDKLNDALHLYLKFARQLEEERWCQAYVGLLLSMGDTLLSRCTLRDRLKFYGNLACAGEYLPSAETSFAYCSTFKAEFESDWALERMANSPILPWFVIRSLKSDQKSILCGCELVWTVEIENRFPASMDISSISLCYSVSPGARFTIVDGSQRNIIFKKLSDFRRESCSVASDVADCGQLYRMESSGGDGRRQLPPGRHSVTFGGQCSSAGVCIPEHVHIRLGDDRLDVQVRLAADASAHCSVKDMEPRVVLISPVDDESLWAGVTQTVKFRLMAGAVSHPMECNEDKCFRLETLNSDLQLKNLEEEETEGNILLVNVPADLAPGSHLDVDQTVFCNIHGSEESRICEVTSFWRGYSFTHKLNFKPIFHWMSDLKVIGERLLLSITLHNDGQRTLLLRDPKLAFATMGQDRGDVCAELLNDENTQDLEFGCPYTLAWYVPPACASLGIITFNYQFKGSSWDGYICYADVALQKPAIVEACCQLASEKIVCRVGMTCDFVVSLKALDSSLRSSHILVTLTFDPRFWLCVSSSSELVRLKNNGLGQALFQVVPQCVGFLPMPSMKAQLTGEAALTKACQAYVRSKGKQLHVLAPLNQPRRSFIGGFHKDH